MLPFIIVQNMKKSIQVLDVVALLHDKADDQLVAGQVGTVVEVLDDGVYEVEFSDCAGKMYAMATLKNEDLIVLHYSPTAA